jgi:hypothetical protein
MGKANNVILSEANSNNTSLRAKRSNQGRRNPLIASARRFVGVGLAMTSILFALAAPVQAEILQRLDGRVLQVNDEERLLFVDFEHPVSGEHLELKFSVDANARFKHVKELGTLKEGDLVAIDYYDHGELLNAVYVIHVPLKLAYTTRREVAKTLLKIGQVSQSS